MEKNMLLEIIKHYATRKIKPQREPGISRIDNTVPETGLYLHVPFCKAFCDFCPYHKYAYNEELLESFGRFMVQEFNLYPKRVYDSLYIGGGTPTVRVDLLEKWIAYLRPSISGEIAVELHPLDATNKNLVALHRMGVDFISFGAQSMHEKVLEHFGRNHTVKDNHNALKKLMNAGFRFVDADLVFDCAEFDETIIYTDFETLCLYQPQQLSIYPMMRFSYTRYKTKNDAEKEYRIFRRIDEIADKKGYERDMLWTYRLKGLKERYSSVARPFFIGIGPSAASYNGKGFFTNTFDYGKYTTKIKNGMLPISYYYPLEEHESSLFYLFWALYRNECDTKKWSRHFPGSKHFERMMIAYLRAKKYITNPESSVYSLTEKGRKALHYMEEWLTYAMIDPLWSNRI
jgi:oxygen-independent coproporphyrinogen-3 oxidase